MGTVRRRHRIYCMWSNKTDIFRRRCLCGHPIHWTTIAGTNRRRKLTINGSLGLIYLQAYDLYDRTLFHKGEDEAEEEDGGVLQDVATSTQNVSV